MPDLFIYFVGTWRADSLSTLRKTYTFRETIFRKVLVLCWLGNENAYTGRTPLYTVNHASNGDGESWSALGRDLFRIQ